MFAILWNASLNHQTALEKSLKETTPISAKYAS